MRRTISDGLTCRASASLTTALTVGLRTPRPSFSYDVSWVKRLRTTAKTSPASSWSGSSPPSCTTRLRRLKTTAAESAETSLSLPDISAPLTSIL